MGDRLAGVGHERVISPRGPRRTGLGSSRLSLRSKGGTVPRRPVFSYTRTRVGVRAHARVRERSACQRSCRRRTVAPTRSGRIPARAAGGTSVAIDEESARHSGPTSTSNDRVKSRSAECDPPARPWRPSAAASCASWRPSCSWSASRSARRAARLPRCPCRRRRPSSRRPTRTASSR
ncbi:hypothetical protein DB32_003832 [Sandaracinus amylolyticus]|uniref:Uncharacterized protein n=1 Tax=Sandaracinus amylolyticus TaxID=927083 RepID=A0A0F6W3Z3_9BACT|nr:hypothetical protein DB32_003832 [Sandaracinus amylolyticus]